MKRFSGILGHGSTALLLGAVLGAMLAAPHGARAANWAQVQDIKKELLGTAAAHAMEQQKTTAAAPAPIAFPGAVQVQGGLALAGNTHAELTIQGTVSPTRQRGARGGGGQPDFIRFDLPQPMDMVSKYSGLALVVHTEKETSPEVRIGARLIAADGKIAEILPAVLLSSAWGSNPHEIYLDWSFCDYPENPAGTAATVAILKHVKTIELTFGGTVRAPERGPSKGDQPANFELSDLRVVDYLKGSYDPSRNDWVAGKPGAKMDLTLQHRVQEVTGIVARYGGAAGVKSAIDSLDMCVRTQCWDGSFLDGRRGAVTVASGEYTFGFWIYGASDGYEALRAMKAPALQEKITIGPETMTRDAFYQRMFYRAAMARTAAVPSKYRDEIIGGNTLITGANRVLGYAIGMRIVAGFLDDPKLKAQVLSKYQPIMQEIVGAQGRYSGGFPLLGEGDRYQGRGIHYDVGYTRTHMDVLVSGLARTGDPLLVKMLQRYQTVFEALMDQTGTGIVPMLSERHPSTEDVDLILPDITAQMGMKYHLPVIAQWGYNDGMPKWAKYVPGKPLNHFTYIARIRGYPLGAHSQVLTADTLAEPEPKDLGYLFPRQFPIWSSRFMNKDAPDKVVHTSKVYVYPDGHAVNDFKPGIGEFPVTVGVPVSVKSTDGILTCEAVEFTGWPKLLAADAPVKLIYAAGATKGVMIMSTVNKPISLTLDKPTTITLTGPDVTLPPEAGGATIHTQGKFILTPEKPGQKVEIVIHNGTVPQDQKTIAPGSIGK